MIREFNINDLDSINEIGNQIKEDFVNKENIKDIFNQDYSTIYVCEEDNIIKGFLHIENHFEITDIINIAVAIKHQKEGIGSQLLEYLIKNTTANKLMLEVRENNVKAINLYNKYGFNIINKRINYYGNESALIMERSI